MASPIILHLGFSFGICCLYRNKHATSTVLLKKRNDDTGSYNVEVEQREESPRFRVACFSEQVDLVITWVNGSDPLFINSLSKLNKSSYDFRTTSVNRFRDWGTLRYCLRSVEKYANWIRHVYIVTNGQVPSWLNLQNPRVSIVKHSEIFRNNSHLPTFNSMAIECHLHRIPGLSGQFLYMNDDLFFAGEVEPHDFYTRDTGFKIRFDTIKVPDCTETCKLSDINNGICDAECNASICDWDGEDCKGDHTNTTRLSGLDSHDSFFGALMYTVYQYNKVFGYVDRKVPAHVPFLIDKALMNELQNIVTILDKSEDSSYYATGDPASLEKGLQYLLQHRHKKFICINDHMRYPDPRKEARNQAVTDRFFKELFPTPSSFEQQ